MPIMIFENSRNFQSYAAGQVVFKEGDPGEIMYVVKDGEVDITVKGKVVETVGKGGIIGEMALVASHRRSATVVARTDCKLVPIDEERFTFMVQQTPSFSLQVMKLMAERLRRMNSGTPGQAPAFSPVAEKSGEVRLSVLQGDPERAKDLLEQAGYSVQLQAVAP